MGNLLLTSVKCSGKTWTKPLTRSLTTHFFYAVTITKFYTNPINTPLLLNLPLDQIFSLTLSTPLTYLTSLNLHLTTPGRVREMVLWFMRSLTELWQIRNGFLSLRTVLLWDFLSKDPTTGLSSSTLNLYPPLNPALLNLSNFSLASLSFQLFSPTPGILTFLPPTKTLPHLPSSLQRNWKI